MGQDENKNPFSGNVTPNPRATFTSGNRLGMRPSRDLSAMDELSRISADSNPNQLQAQPTGDIVLNNGDAPKSGSKKRFVIITGIILVFAALVGAAAFFMVNQNRSTGNSNANNFSDEELTKIFEQYGENSAKIDVFFRKINSEKYNGGEIFTEEVSNDLKTQLSSIQSLKTAITPKGSANELVKDELSSLKQKLNTNLEIYSNAAKVYDDFYSAITKFNASSIQKYLTSEPQKSATEKYITYINNATNITNLQTQIDTTCPAGTDTNTNISQACSNLLTEFLTLTAVLDDAETLTNIFSPVTEDLSKDETPISKSITNIMNGLGI